MRQNVAYVTYCFIYGGYHLFLFSGDVRVNFSLTTWNIHTPFHLARSRSGSDAHYTATSGALAPIRGERPSKSVSRRLIQKSMLTSYIVPKHTI